MNRDLNRKFRIWLGDNIYIILGTIAVIGMLAMFVFTGMLETTVYAKELESDIMTVNGPRAGICAITPNIGVVALKTAEPIIEPVEASEPETRPSDLLSDDDKILFANIVWQEARGESREGQIAVAEVVCNRVKSSRFPDTVRGVVSYPGAFESYDKVKNYGSVMDPAIYELAMQVLDGELSTLNDGGVIYFKVSDGSRTFWDGHDPLTIGNHTFYRVDNY